jgi:CheY-specific phosphatase CheX
MPALATLKRVPLDPAWKEVPECATVEVFHMMPGVRLIARLPPAHDPISESAPPQKQRGLTAMVGMAGALCGITTIHRSADTAIRLASKMASDEAAKDPNIVSDALGELCNMVVGNFEAKIPSLSDHCMLSVSTEITGENYALQSAEPSESLTVPLSIRWLRNPYRPNHPILSDRRSVRGPAKSNAHTELLWKRGHLPIRARMHLPAYGAHY